jgi:spore germination protein YaaH
MSTTSTLTADAIINKKVITTVLVASTFLVALLLPHTSFAASRTMTLGMSGADVKSLQDTLTDKGYLTATPTGYFGAATLAAVKKFQCEQKIVCSGSSYGIAGPATQAALAVMTPSVTTGGTLTGKSLTPPYTGPLEFSGWVPDWRLASATLDTTPHLSSLKSVMPFAYEVNSDGTIRDISELSKNEWPAFIAAAKAAKSRVIPTIMWGDGQAMHNVLSNATTRVALEDAIANLVKTNNFDGIDIDFEAKQEQTRDYFSLFLKGLYSRMGNKWVYCAIESRSPLNHRYLPGQTIPPDATDYANDYNAINKYCDRVEIMAYDQGTVDQLLNGARSAPYAPVADPAWVEALVTLAAQNIAKSKIIIGVATYGYEYTVTPQDGSFKYQRMWAFNPRYGTQIASQLGITPTRTSANEMGFIYDPNKLNVAAPSGADSTQVQQTTQPSTTIAQNSGSQVNTNAPFNYMVWSDASAIADKVSLARRLGIRGVAVFSMGGAEDQGMWSVLK